MRVKWDRSKGAPEPIRALNRIPERESHEPLVDLREVAPQIMLPRETTIPFVRKTVGEMVVRAALLLPKGVHLAVTDAYRPVIRQKLIYDWLSACALEVWPNITHAVLRRKVNRWVAPFDQKAPPGHSTGGAIDVLLQDESGEPLDVHSPYDRFSAAPTYTIGLSPEAERNRMLLVETMLAAGFSNCRDEWWHYSYGDAGWAVRTGAAECFYGRIDLPEELYAHMQEVWLRNLHERPNPFKPHRAS
ncbi:MAG: D-alanyl-D-alanine dipeptidase [Fimbriimonadaceae bacterium]|nr:D-alanyl-D-alanine dipeptidase [Fimbriimonadaceae bacterium]